MRVSIAVAIAVLISSGPALAGDKDSEKTQDPSQKIVCKSERFVGSNLSTRICKTRAEWDLAKKESQELLDRRDGEMRAPKPHGNGG
jgi:hypothetical protein